MLIRTLSAALVLTIAATSVPQAVAVDDAANQQKLVEEKLPTLVTVKFILKGGDQDEEREALGTVIDPAGLVLVSNNAFDGLMARFGGPTTTPTDIKVLVGDDTQGLEAKLLARDSDLQLAWIQLAAPPAKPLAFVDLEKNASSQAKLGDNLYVVGQLGKFFDRSGTIAHGNVASIVKKPRELLIPSVGLAGNELGMVVYDGAGKVVGVTTLILPEQEEVQGSPGGMRQAMRGIISGSMVIPASEVVSATKRAKEAPPEAAKEPAAPSTHEKPADPAAPGKTAPEQPK